MIFISVIENQEIRKEVDSFGTVEISNQFLYGVQTVRAVQNLSFSGKTLSQYPKYIESLAIVKKAAAITNIETGAIDESIGSFILQACDELISGRHFDQFPVDILHGGGGIGTNMNINEVIANIANELNEGMRGTYSPIHPNDDVNASQSTSDVCHTAMRLAIMKEFEQLNLVLSEVQTTIEKMVDSFIEITTISRTCLQDAMRIQLGDFISGYAAMLSRRQQLLKQSVIELKKVNLGGTVIGTGTGASTMYQDLVIHNLSKVAGFQLQKRENLIDAAQNIDDLANVSNQLTLLATCLIKMGKDLRLLSSGPEAGFSEIILPSVMAGSSFFPGKVNPVIPETLIQSCFQVLGCDRVVQAALEHGELNLNIFEGVAGANIIDAIKMLEKALNLFNEKCLEGIKVNKEKCKEYANSLIPSVVELKEKHGYSFVSKLMKEKGKNSVKELLNGGGLEND
ncbi:lyase family protein [Bacillus sp. AFS002410]|uniref:lyase family protein n=1 Tax=Bacillus sp. AFS002410 TaxID=2033481 RepID=UPI00211D4B6F|nr:lyase family protein [Bacillus sp. AFS002410]